VQRVTDAAAAVTDAVVEAMIAWTESPTATPV
jgi:hypothetical protein